MSVAVNGSKAVLGMSNRQLKVLDISNVNAPVEQGTLTDVGLPTDIKMSGNGNYAFIADYAGDSIRVVDVSNPMNPVQIANVPTPWTPNGLNVQDNLLYVAAKYGVSAGVYAFDVSNPTTPTLVKSYPTFNASEIAFAQDPVSEQDVMFVASGSSGLVVLKTKDVAVPEIHITAPSSSPTITTNVASLNLGGDASDNQGVTRVTWSNDRGGGGDAVGTTNWFVSGIALQPGTNILIVTAFDQAGNGSNDVLTVIYQTPKQSQTITFPTLADKTFGDAPIPLVAAASSGLTVSFSVLSGPATRSNNVLTITGAGTVNVRASQSGNVAFNAAPDVTNSFNVGKADQAITFGLLPDKSVGAAPFAVNATASSGLPIMFSIVSGPATVSSNGATLTGAGTVTVRASQSGNTNFNPAMYVDRNFVVAKLPQFISFGALSRQVFGDAPFALSASASSGLLVSFSVLSGPAIVSGNILTPTGAGLVVLRASQSGDATNAPAPNADQVLIVVPGNNVITDFQRLANGMFTFRFYGEPGTNYVVQASTNLVNWLTLATNQVSGLGYLEFTDPSAANFNRRFYRIAPLSAVGSGGPLVTIQLDGNTVVLSWPTNATGFTLESVANLPATIWISNSSPAAIVNGQYMVTNGTSGGRRFYRLKK